jgi:hypothetical protein
VSGAPGRRPSSGLANGAASGPVSGADASSRAALALALALALAGGALRFAGLGDRLLDGGEAGSAWTAWSMAHGVAPPALERPPESALLLGVQAMAFWMTGGAGEGPLDGEWLARLAPAALGLLAVAAPWLCRRRIGIGAAAIASGLLALDPGWVAMARRADGVGLAGALTVAVIACLIAGTSGPLRSAAGDRAGRWEAGLLWVLAAALGALAVSGPATWDVAVPLLLVAFLVSRSAGARSGDTKRPDVDLPRLLRRAGVIALLLASSGLTQFRGVQAVSTGLGSWLASWAEEAPATVPAARPGGVSWAAEAPVLALGAIAAVLLLVRASSRQRAAQRTAQRTAQGAAPARVAAAGLAGLWLAWGTLLALRPGGPGGAWIVLSLPLFAAIAAACGPWVDRLLASRTLGSRGARWAPTAVATGLALVAAGATARAAGERERLGADSSLRLLVADVAALALDRSGAGAGHALLLEGDLAGSRARWPDPALGWALRELGREGARGAGAGRAPLMVSSADGVATLWRDGEALGRYRLPEGSR